LLGITSAVLDRSETVVVAAFPARNGLSDETTQGYAKLVGTWRVLDGFAAPHKTAVGMRTMQLFGFFTEVVARVNARGHCR
jgi:hypothetical protein